ncbi:exocyst complex component EXO70A [Spatholobus suberectus]|nr:exocyst complex component EXO70A [Spatholobus suberectus]
MSVKSQKPQIEEIGLCLVLVDYEHKSVISTCEQDQHVVAAAQHILKALAASKTVSDDLRKTLLDLDTQLSAMSMVNERKGRGIKAIREAA